MMTKHNLRLIFLLFLFLSVYNLNAQNENYKKGYIITNENDTIQGYIDFRIDEMNCAGCKFRSDISTKETIYLPSDIKAYRLPEEGKYYISKEIEINSEKQIVFLEYLLYGKMNLYYLYSQGKNSRQYFIFESENGELTYLTKDRDQMVDDKIREDNKYKGVLNYLFNTHPEIAKSIPNSNFERSEMIKITKKYHNLTCSPGEECIDYQNNFKKSYLNIRLSVYTGAYHTRITNSYITSFNSPGIYTTSPAIGGTVELTQPRFSRFLSAVVDISFAKYKISEKEEFEKYTKTLVQNSIGMHNKINIKYTYDKYRLKPTIEGGFSLYHFFITEAKLDKNYKIGGIEPPHSSYDISKDLNTHNDYFGFNAAIGVTCNVAKKDFYLKLAYEYTSYFTDPKVNEKMQAFSLKAGIFLK